MAIAPVVIEFLAKGMPQVQQAFQSIHAAAVKAERAQQVEADKTTKAVKKSVDERVKFQIAAMKKADAWQRQAWAAGDREAARHAKNQEQNASRSEKAKLKALKDRIAASKVAEKELESYQRGAARQQEQEAARAEKSKARAIRDRIASTKQAEKDLDAWQRSQQRQRAQEERANRPAKEPKLSGRNSSALGRFVESAGGATIRGVGAGLNRAGSIAMGLATTAGQLGGGFSITDSVMGEKNMRKQAAVLSASTLLTGNKADEIGTDAILSRAKAVGLGQNIDPSEVLAGFDEIKKQTGDLGMAMNLSPAVAKIATATGSDMSDVSKLAGNLLANRGHYEKKDAAKVQQDIESQLRVLTKQGIVGGVELEDMAKYGARLTAGSVMFGGDKSTNEATLGAMAQMSRQYGGAATPAEAALASNRFSSDVAAHSAKLKANLGIDARDGKGNLRDAQSLILEMLQKTGGDVTRLKETGLGERGVRPLIGAANLYKSAGGGEKGLDAVKKEFAKYTSGVSPAEVDAANKRVLAEQGFEKSMLELKIAAGEQLLPAFKDMLLSLKELIPAFVNAAKIGIPAFTDLMTTVAKFVDANRGIIESLAAHPVGSLIAFELTKSFAAAGLPALLRGLFSGAFGQQNIPGSALAGGPGAPGGKGGNPALGIGIVTAAAAIAYDGYQNYQAGDKRAGEMAAAVRSGAISPDAASKEVAAAKGQIAKQNSWGSQLLEAGENLIGGPAAGFYNSYKHAEGAGNYSLSENKELKRAIAEAAAAGVREGVANGLKNNSGANGEGRKEPIINR